MGSEPDEIILVDIVAAWSRMAAHLWPTVPRLSAALSDRCGAQVWLKPENLQRTGSFKVRGAFNRVRELSGRGVRQVITASAGNHGQGVALAAATFGIDATVVVPEQASPAKVAALQRMGVELILRGQGFDEADAAMHELAVERGIEVVSPYDRAVVAGQGTVALELLRDVPDLDLLLVPVGSGGLIAGCAVAAKGINPHVRVVGIQPEVSPSMVAALQAGRIVSIACGDSLADGLAGNIAGGELPFALIQRYVDDVVLVSEEAIAQAMRVLVAEERLVVEGAGAVGLAAMMSGKVDVTGQRVGLVVSGGNVAIETLEQVVRATA